MVATFDFTDRAVPIVQFGRVERSADDSVWGRAHWGVGTWSLESWEPDWWDATCDVHEIVTDTGRTNAVDRFSPATANIVASNVNNLFDQLFPELPPPQPLEYIGDPEDEVTLFVDPAMTLAGTWSGHGVGVEATVGPFTAAQVGDVLFVTFVSGQDETGAVRVTLPGFTQLNWVQGNFSDPARPFSLITYRRKITVADFEAGPYTWTATLDESAPWNWVAAGFRNVDESDPENHSGFFLDQPIGPGDPVEVRCLNPSGGANEAGSMVMRYYASYNPEPWPDFTGCATFEHVNEPSEWSWDAYLAFDGTAGAPSYVGPGAVDVKSMSLVSPAPQYTISFTLVVKPGPAVEQPPPYPQEMGTQVRIGVDHETLGVRWLFRGFVDALVPTFVPDREDGLRIECFDSLGEVGRVEVGIDNIPAESESHQRVTQILNRANWPRYYRHVEDDATIMSEFAAGRAVDALTRVAESCGGAVYGDPVTGKVTFRGRDWQTFGPTSSPEAFITNGAGPFAPEDVPQVCPVGWEMSWRRSATATRAYFTSDLGVTKAWRAVQAERYFGIEDYHTDVLATTAEALNELAIRHLRLQSVRVFPRVEAVLLDAATADNALDLMTTASFTGPSRYRCQHRRDDGTFVINHQFLVTGIRHVIRPAKWTCRLALHRAGAFAEEGGAWGTGRWGKATWGHRI